MNHHRACRIGIFGAGNWGTALAHMLATQGHDIVLWAREAEVVESINKSHFNSLFLKDIHLHPRIKATQDLAQTIVDREIFLFVIPAQYTRVYLNQLKGLLKPDLPLVICSKGIERSSLATMHEIFENELSSEFHNSICVLSGPSFAIEVAQDMPTNVTLAARNLDVAKHVQRNIASRNFRVYTTQDLVGVELGGALKNVIAIAVGGSDGLGFGNNTRAGLITRGLAEITRMAIKMGGRSETLLGLAGVGDLILTCTSDLSRNRQVGKYLAQGLSANEIKDKLKMIAEGVPTAESAYRLAQRHSIDTPITEQVYQVIYKDKGVLDAMKTLQSRALKNE